MDKLPPTAKVLLGLLRNRPRTGYELKAAVDKSTRFFWAASYGQIYPELKRLEQAGLVRSLDDPHGARRRTVYEITAAGEKALHAWLTSEADTAYELRDEGLLKFFFATALSPEEARAAVAARRRLHESRLSALREVESALDDRDGFAYRTLMHGIGLHQHIIDWCRDQERDLKGTAR